MGRRMHYFTRKECKNARTTQNQQSRALKSENRHRNHRSYRNNTHRKERPKLNKLHNLARNFSESNLDNNSVIFPHQIIFDNCNICEYCLAIKLPNERSGICCSNGKDKIRIYNSIFSFATVGVKLDPKLANAKAVVYTYCVQSSFYHRIGSLLQESGSDPQYLQMYTWDTNNEMEHQLNAIPDVNVNPMIIQYLKNVLDMNNPYVAHLRYISEILNHNITNLSLIIHTNIPRLDQRTNNSPTAPQVAVIWINEDVPSNVKQKPYSLLFPCGEQGWIPRCIPYNNFSDIPIQTSNNESHDYNEHNNNESDMTCQKFVTAKEYYA
ncbi:3116_t:CDS:2, partial [Gigaspora rosea]